MNNKLLKGILMIIIILEVLICTDLFKEEVYASEDVVKTIIENYVNEDAYGDINNISTCNFQFQKYNYAASNSSKVCKDLNDAAQYLKEEMVKRKEEIVLSVKVEYYYGISNEIFRRAVTDYENLSSSEGDYLMKNFSKYSCSIKISDDGWIKFIYTNEYLTTKSQEQQVDNEVKRVLKELGIKNEAGISNMSEYGKVRIIHDYIVKNIFYDYDYKNYSAYNAIIDKNVVCQGFASLAYKMFKEAGVKTRIITGWVNKGSSHAWNIVRIDGQWFNIDTTWDENLSTRDKMNLNYDYCLKNEEDFSGHYKDDKYKDDEFIRNHPISNKSYPLFTASKEDANYDGAIDIEDLAILANAYNIDNSSNKWNSRYDIVEDNIIDIYDIVALSSKISD